MSLLDQLGRRPQGGQQQDPRAALQEIQRGPAAFLNRHGFQVPEGLNSPQQIIPYLLNSGQITQDQLMSTRRKLGM